MSVGQVYTHPDRTVLKAVLSGRRLMMVSPFYSSASLRLIDSKNMKNISFITRLPTQYIMPPAFIENHPLALAGLLEKMKNRLKLFALPDLHAKMYQNENATWIGSSNFTINGFSGKPEILIRFDEENTTWSPVFDTYLENSIRVRRKDLKKLSRWISLGLTKVRTQHHTADSLSGETRKSPLTFEDFVEWLSDAGQPHPTIRKHIHDRVRGKNYMSGHVPQAYNGTMSFLRMNSGLLPDIEKAEDESIPNHILEELASFVRKFGDEYRGPRGGYWRNYLSTKLGGRQVNGGAGDTIVKKCLVLAPSYIAARRQSQFG